VPGPEPQVNPQNIEETRRQIQRLFEEVARLSELDLLPADYFGEFLKRVLAALAAPAGAVWMRTPQGNLQLQYQVNLQNLGLNRSEEAQQAHQELLRLAFQQPRPLHLPPQSFAGQSEEGKIAPGNPTDYILLLVPIQVENQVDGLLEVWQDPNRNPAAVSGFLQFMTEMCQLASRYLRNRLMRQMAGQQALWTQLEAFSRTIHGSLSPVETAYLIANEGRRLVDCDRISIAVRYARKCKVEAVSGADVVERRSNLVQLMQKLFDTVLAWGEKLVYSGTKDEGLPPDVMKALDDYLGESNSKLLVVLPLKDEREKDTKKKPRSAMMMECFEPQQTPEQLVARLEVVGKHAAPALYNAVEHRRIPMRFLWVPLAKIQEGLGGKARAIAALIIAAVVVLAAVLYFVPYQLKMEATGQLLPEERINVFSVGKGYVEDVAVQPGERVTEKQALVKLTDTDLAKQITQLDFDIEAAKKKLDVVVEPLSLNRGGGSFGGLSLDNKAQLEQAKVEANAAIELKRELRRKTLDAYGVITDQTGAFWLKAPKFPEVGRAPGEKEPFWTVLTPDFRETLRRKPVDPREPVLRLGNKEGRWEVEAKIPQKHVGQVLHAFDYPGAATENPDTHEKELDVDLILRSEPTHTYRGKLSRNRIANQADPNKSDNNEPEPVVRAWIRISGDDIPEDKRVPKGDPMLADTEVKIKIRCGYHKMGYSLFYGVWEFFYEKVVFFF
jgi:hypothetical protein